MPKVPITSNEANEAVDTVKSVLIYVANIPATITATVVKSTSKADIITTIFPKILLFPILTDDPLAGVDVDVVTLNGVDPR